MIKPTKDELLAKYQDREPSYFIQFDVVINAKPDDVTRPDEDRDDICATETYELMRGTNVRVLIKPGTLPGQVRRALKKIRRMIQKSGLPNFDGPKAIDDPFANW